MIKIDGYPIDLAITETLNLESTVTKYPIERGAKIADHVQNEPPTITLEGIVSDTPIGVIATDPTRQVVTGGALPSKDALTRLLAIRDAKEPVVIECNLGRFEQMIMTSLEVPKSKEVGKALQFTVTFEQITLTTNNRTTVRVAIPNGSGRDNLGNKESKEWGANFKLPGRIFVTSHAAFERQAYIKSGFVLKLTTTHVDRLSSNPSGDDFGNREIDHFEIRGDTKPDGYLDSFIRKTDETGDIPAGRLVYHRFRVTATATGFKGQTEPLKHKLDGRNVHYDYAENGWVDDENGQVVRRHKTRAGQPGHMDEKWRGVEYGSNLPGGGIPSGGS